MTLNHVVLRALVVDDETLARGRMRTLLGDCTSPAVHCVGEAANAVQAMEMLQHQAVDVALLDIHMPGADGLSLARMLQTLPTVPAPIFPRPKMAPRIAPPTEMAVSILA